MKRRKLKYITCTCVILFIYNFFGVGDYFFSKSFDKEFDYPLNIDIRPLVKEVMAEKKPSVSPINYYPYKFLTNSNKCKSLERLDLLIAVKSAMDHYSHRMVIRKTYGQESFLPGRIIKTLFFLGIGEAHNSEVQMKIDEEFIKYKDIIQVDFRDSYFNNTIKTMMSFKWAYYHCSTADFYLFTDDDMYISVENLLTYVNDRMTAHTVTSNPTVTAQKLKSEKDGYLFAGYVFKSAPHRYRISKWRVSMEEYPWNKWPPYATAGAYVLSNKSLKEMYIASLFVKHFRFDDIYLGIVAMKIGLPPVHCSEFYFYKRKYDKQGYRNVIASHGYGDHEELMRVWNEQNIVV